MLFEIGNVVFFVGFYGWVFILISFVKMWVRKYYVDEKKMMEKLWGEYCFDFVMKRWFMKFNGLVICCCGFVYFVYNFIRNIIRSFMNNEIE